MPDYMQENKCMDIQENRRRNLALVIKERYKNNQRRFAIEYDTPPPNISQMLKGSRSFGNDWARRIEENEGLRPGWMDEEIPLSDEAMSLAREFMLLGAERRAEILVHMKTLVALESHERTVAAMLTGSTHSWPVKAQQ